MLCVAVGFVPSFAVADWTAFIPRPFENGAFLDTSASFERDDIRGSRPVRWTDTFVKEKLSLFSNGYSYHPRFLQYQFTLAGTGRQEEYESSRLKSLGWRLGSGLEYDAALFFLPEHPYNLKLFARRYEPLFKEQAATQHNSVETSRGASFRYRKKPYFLHASYGDDSIESGESSSDVTRFSVDGEYFKRYQSGNELSFTGAVKPSWFSNSQGLEGNSAEYLVGNFLNLERVPAWAVPVRVNSSLSKNSFDQESRGSGQFKNDQLAWYELLTAYLPWNFRTDLSYRHQENEGSFHEAGAAPARTVSETGNDIQFDVVHRLYESLDTTYTLLRDSRTYSAGETTALSQSLALNYTKSIPRGRILTGVNVARSETDNRGRADVGPEQYSATFPVPGYFTLRQPNVEPGSSNVSILCTDSHPCPLPFVTGQRIPLSKENGDYFEAVVGNATEIHVLQLPAPFPPLGLIATYDFLVLYSTSGDFTLRSDTFSGNASVELFDNLLTPYFTYVTIRSDVLSGVFPGIPLDSTTYTTGLLFHLGPLRVRGEYQDLQWQVSPYQAWRAEVQYVWPVNPTTSVYATGAYLNKYYPRGTSYYPRGTSVSYAAPFTEEVESASGSIQKQLFSRNMYLAAGGSYSWMQGLVDTSAYSLNTSLMWKIGKLDVSVGASTYESDTTGTTIISTRRDHQLFYVRLRRRLL